MQIQFFFLMKYRILIIINDKVIQFFFILEYKYKHIKNKLKLNINIYI